MLSLSPPFGVAPMAGMTDTAFRRLVKRHGGCGLVVTEMVSSEGLVRGIDRTLEYAEYTEEERPVAVQIFGGDPDRMAEAARIVEGMGADIVDVNMGCPVPKIAKHNAGCSLMREPDHAATIIGAMAKAVRIPVTVKMRAGWNDREVNAPALARMVEDAGAAAVTVHGRTAAQSYSGHSDWELIARVAEAVSIPVIGTGDCVEAVQILERLRESGVAGVLIGRGVLRNPWILAQAADLVAGRPARAVTAADRSRFLLDYIDLLLAERVAEPAGFRHEAPARLSEAVGPKSDPLKNEGEAEAATPLLLSVDAAGRQAGPDVGRPAIGRERWVINKLRALCAWYTKGLDGGAHLRVAVNRANSIAELRDIIHTFFDQPQATGARR